MPLIYFLITVTEILTSRASSPLVNKRTANNLDTPSVCSARLKLRSKCLCFSRNVKDCCVRFNLLQTKARRVRF